MKSITNLNEARVLFPDAIKLKLRIDTPTTIGVVRRLIPDSVTIIYCKISKNYVSLIYSKRAKEIRYPDVTLPNSSIKSSDCNFWLSIYCGDDSTISLTTSFCPSCYPDFTRSLEDCGYGEVEMVENYQEAGMGLIYFKLNESLSSRDDLLLTLHNYLDCYVSDKESVEIVHIGTRKEEI